MTGYILRWFTRPQTVTHHNVISSRTNMSIQGLVEMTHSSFYYFFSLCFNNNKIKIKQKSIIQHGVHARSNVKVNKSKKTTYGHVHLTTNNPNYGLRPHGLTVTQVLTQQCTAGSQTHDLLITSPTPSET